MGGAATAVRTVLCARVGQEARLFLVGWIEFIVFNLERCESFETIQAVFRDADGSATEVWYWYLLGGKKITRKRQKEGSMQRWRRRRASWQQTAGSR
jgi:hypothetical protein